MSLDHASPVEPEVRALPSMRDSCSPTQHRPAPQPVSAPHHDHYVRYVNFLCRSIVLQGLTAGCGILLREKVRLESAPPKSAFLANFGCSLEGPPQAARRNPRNDSIPGSGPGSIPGKNPKFEPADFCRDIRNSWQITLAV